MRPDISRQAVQHGDSSRIAVCRNLASELLLLADSGVVRFYLGHGGKLNAREVRRHVETLLAIS
jgi:hypothetical protein